MRGEETLCLGALATGSLRPGDTLVSTGSHWKRISTDADGRVTGSRSSLGGELAEVVKSWTVIAEAVPEAWPERLAPEAIARGDLLFALYSGELPPSEDDQLWLLPDGNEPEAVASTWQREAAAITAHAPGQDGR